jgi:limonene-1,2-epoxide hydrolase
MSENSLDTVRRFEAAWRAADLAAVYALMTDDIFYHNIPRQPVQGLEAVKRYVDDYVARFGRLLSVDWDVKNIAVNGETVFVERISRLSWENGHRTRCPIVGVFDVRDGKIASWRDYFDKATFDA